jgi:hypothetical protein
MKYLEHGGLAIEDKLGQDLQRWSYAREGERKRKEKKVAPDFFKTPALLFYLPSSDIESAAPLASLN